MFGVVLDRWRQRSGSMRSPSHRHGASSRKDGWGGHAPQQLRVPIALPRPTRSRSSKIRRTTDRLPGGVPLQHCLFTLVRRRQILHAKLTLLWCYRWVSSPSTIASFVVEGWTCGTQRVCCIFHYHVRKFNFSLFTDRARSCRGFEMRPE